MGYCCVLLGLYQAGSVFYVGNSAGSEVWQYKLFGLFVKKGN
jgi:hypothetical protein